MNCGEEILHIFFACSRFGSLNLWIQVVYQMFQLGGSFNERLPTVLRSHVHFLGDFWNFLGNDWIHDFPFFLLSVVLTWVGPSFISFTHKKKTSKRTYAKFCLKTHTDRLWSILEAFQAVFYILNMLFLAKNKKTLLCFLEHSFCRAEVVLFTCSSANLKPFSTPT